MIDSVVFYLYGNGEQFELRQDNKLDGRKNQQERGYGISSEYCNEYIGNLSKQGIYCPSITKAIKTNSKIGTREVLEIQVSLPKLIYGSNLFEVDSEDLDKIYAALLSRLDDFGIITTKEKLQKALVKRADYSKIVKLPDYLGTADKVVEDISKFNYKPSSDYNFHKYYCGNSGRSIKFWNGTQGYVIYDIIGNILANGFTKTEQTIIKGYQNGQVKRTALRFELSLETKGSFDAVIRRRIKGTEKTRDFYLDEILKEDLAREILLDVFDKVFSNLAIGLLSLADIKDNRLRAYLDSSGLSIRKQEKLYYWASLTTSFGYGGFQEQVKLKHKGGSIDRCKKEIALILAELGETNGSLPNLIKFLRTELEKFDIIKPKRA